MLLMIFGWVMVAARPNWSFLWFFTGAIFALNAILTTLGIMGEKQAYLAETEISESEFVPFMLADAGIGALVAAGVFAGVGAIVVAVRKWLASRQSKGDKSLDDEMARIRAEISSRSDKVD